MGSLLAPILSFLGTVFSPVTFLFHYIFYQPVFNVLMLIYALVHNFALSIVILTLIIRACLIPLTRRQLRSSRVMQELAPQLNELRAQYKDDPQGLLQAQQALYKEHGVSLYGGCLPLVVQLPFLYALYYSFFTVLSVQKVTETINGHVKSVNESLAHHISRINADIYPFVPHLTRLPDTHFFWANLASPDPLHILPILAGLLTFIQLRMALPVRKPQPRSASAGPDPTQTMGMMQYIMPFFTFFIGLNFPAGLALYWCITTGFSAVQQYFISGWGSLFVGVPGMERFVPAPKELPTTAPTTTTRGAGSPRSNATNTTKADAPPEPTDGKRRGILQQMRDNFASAQKAAQEAADARRQPINAPAKAENAAPQESAASGVNGSGDTGANGVSRERRPRSSKGVTLVKTAVSGAAPANGSASSDGSNGSNGNNGNKNGAKKTLLPEQAIKRDAVGVSASSTAGGATAKQPTSGVSVSKPNGANGTSGGAKGDRTKASQAQGRRGRSNGSKRR
ncbi:MAG TPA: YidC/Oxa1 family membrane protein insertase [Ktedonobacterales bacterium]|nr:YidC/Oxa1 family membrane protein insertase [Ktedonobacterales bacterium]